MKILFLLLVLLIAGCNDTQTNSPILTEDKILVKSEDTVMVRIRNFTITGDKLRFDIDCKLASATPFIMGSSTFVLNATNLINPVLTNINPKYTIGGGNGYYQMLTSNYDNKLSVQIIYLNSPGSFVSNDFERIATVTMDIVSNDLSVGWNTQYTTVINPIYKKANIMFAESLKIK